MPRRFVSALLLLAVVLLVGLLSRADNPKPATDPAPAPQRVPWTTSNVFGSPDPPAPYRVEIAFPKLQFDEPLDLTTVRGSDRLFVTERFGRVFSFKPNQQIEKPDLLLDLHEVYNRPGAKDVVAYGFAVHPKWNAGSPYVYITALPNPHQETPTGTRVSRFTLLPGDPPRADPKSELVIIEWLNGGHNGGALEFGPDGFLYIATGDASGIGDSLLTGQDLSVLPGKILRIDVDRKDANQNYAVPRDNPFVDQQGARPEIWAYGLRQPWKFSFDRDTGDLWCGNIGQDLWEQIYLIEKGGNYGWSVFEGSHPYRPERPRGPTPILMPIVEHDHAAFRSITGGFVYKGNQFKDLVGAYIYGDYDTGRIWSFRYDRVTRQVSEHRELVKSDLRLLDFAEDAAGELYLLDHMTGRISQLAVNSDRGDQRPFPRRLSETGLFTSTRDHQIAPGVLPYTVIAPQWCDGATKERFLAIPGEGKIDFEAMRYPFAPNTPRGWKFPDGTVIAETLTLDTVDGQRRLETRILHHRRLTGGEEVGDQYWQGYTYVWNDEQTDAELLLDPRGRDRAFRVPDPDSPDGARTQTWHYPARTECIACHNMAAKYAIGVQTAQMNTGNQLRTFEQLGLFSKPLPAPPEELPRLVPYINSGHDLNLRARSYLHANCSHCHRKWGGGNADFHLTATWDLNEMGLVNVRPTHGTFNLPNARLIVPGEPFRSVLFWRMSTLGPAHMPRLGSNVVDPHGARLIHDWIAQLPRTGLISDAQLRMTAEADALVDRLDVFGPAEMEKRLDSILASPELAIRLAHALSGSNLGGRPLEPETRAAILARAAKAEAPEIRDLFERYLPEEMRVKRLGTVIQPEQILAMKGDVERGRKLFVEAQGVQCRTCHRIGGQGREVGPDLDGIGTKYEPSQILDNILNPSRIIEPKYLTYIVETKRGQAFSGLMVSRDNVKLVLKDSTGKEIAIAANEVDSVIAQQKSLMPELLLRDMTAEQVADLTAFLSSLKQTEPSKP